MPEHRATPRYPISIQGRYRVGRGVSRDVVLLDLSETGCRIFDRFGSMRQGAVLSLRIGPIGPIEAIVAWSTGQELGLRFEHRLYGPIFEHIRDQLAERRELDTTTEWNSRTASRW